MPPIYTQCISRQTPLEAGPCQRRRWQWPYPFRSFPVRGDQGNSPGPRPKRWGTGLPEARRTAPRRGWLAAEDRALFGRPVNWRFCAVGPRPVASSVPQTRPAASPVPHGPANPADRRFLCRQLVEWRIVCRRRRPAAFPVPRGPPNPADWRILSARFCVRAGQRVGLRRVAYIIHRSTRWMAKDGTRNATGRPGRCRIRRSAPSGGSCTGDTAQRRITGPPTHDTAAQDPSLGLLGQPPPTDPGGSAGNGLKMGTAPGPGRPETASQTPLSRLPQVPLGAAGHGMVIDGKVSLCVAVLRRRGRGMNQPTQAKD
jgi:hypothetical protein